ncbi:hypothetical protein DF185_18805 [Marinifilum breve]|uniref:DUF4349 domain-containing protein n=1 Tax=Marinifilum breve TaxID=2184082 RepID=A0A2V3ZVL4_9BACT|nr:DUF4349 domain-containing protein [Marinifilum breve]PXX97073.1 hypothetical protein DF185_18805 [Marinifilum breve]
MKNSLYLLLLFAAMITSCNQADNSDGILALSEMAEEELVPITRQQGGAPLMPIDNKEVVKKKIIKDGRIGLKVTNVDAAKARVDSVVKLYGAYYSNENLNNTDWETIYNLTVRIPSVHFESFISAIEQGKGEVLYKEIDARDVTEQFIDLETRLQNKRAYAKKYKDLLKRAKTVKEILEIEEKIRYIEEEIESTSGRLKYLGDLVDYSTLKLNIHKKKDFKYNPDKRDKFSERIKQSLSKGWYGFVDFLLDLVMIWPFWIIIVLIIYLLKRIRRKRKQNKE